MFFLTETIKTATAEALKVAASFNKLLSLSFLITLISSLLILGLVIYTTVTTIKYKREHRICKVNKQPKELKKKL